MNKVIINDFAPLADKYATVPAAGSSPYQSGGDLLKENARELINYASFTGLGLNLSNPGLILAEASDNIGYVSSACSNASRVLSPSVDIVIDIANGLYSAPGITFHFWQNYCTEVTVKWYKIKEDVEELISSKTFNPVPVANTNNSNILTYYGDNSVEDFNRVIISFTKTENAYQFVKLAGIDLGRIREITDFHSNINIFTEIDPDCADVPGSTCDFTAETDDFTPQDKQELYVYGGKNETLFGKFIIDRAPSIGKNRYSFECSDDILKIENPKFPQKLQGTWPVDSLNAEIKAASNVDIECEEYANVVLNGFVEADKSVRMAAAMISFGIGCFLSGFGSKVLKFKKLRNRRNKLISSSQILGRAEYTPIAPYTEIVLNKYSETFDNVADFRIASKTDKRATDAINPLIFDQYSLMSDIDSRIEELKEAGFYRNEISARIEYVDEAPGDICRIETPYDGIKTGVIKSMEISIGHKITANITMIERNFVENEGENNADIL